MAGNTNGIADAHANGVATSPTSTEAYSLRDAWALRNATAQALLLAEGHMQRLVEDADIAQLTKLIEEFSPSRSTGPEWTRTFEPLAERLWAWCDADTMAALHAEFTARGMPWMAVANAFAPERGADLRGRMRRPAYARFPVFTTA
jgi:hypothetical protein